MKKLLVSIKVVYYLWKMGYFLSENAHSDSQDELWGFFRLNFENGGQKKYAIVDIDFAIPRSGERKSYSHVHAGPENSLHRFDSK